MKTITTLALAAAMLGATPALTQDAYPASAPDTDTARAPDGTRAFGFEPYVAVRGGWEQFDAKPNKAGSPAARGRTS